MTPRYPHKVRIGGQGHQCLGVLPWSPVPWCLGPPTYEAFINYAGLLRNKIVFFTTNKENFYVLKKIFKFRIRLPENRRIVFLYIILNKLGNV